MWGDEAHSVFLANSILEYGIPKSIVRDNYYVTHDYDENEKGVWILHPWFPFYIIAGSLKLFGQTTFAARFLLAIFGFLSFIVMYQLFKLLYKKEAITLLALSAVYLPFFLFSRTARYHPLIMLFGAILIYYYFRYLKNLKVNWILFTISTVLLFYSNYLSFIILFIVFATHFIIIKKKKILNIKNNLKLYFSLIISALLALPWVIFSNPLGKRSTFTIDFTRVLNYIQFFLTEYNFTIPLIFVLVGATILFLKLKKEAETSSFILIAMILPLVLMFFSPFITFRYLMVLSPVFIMFFYEIFIFIKNIKIRFSRVIAILIMLVLLLTNFFAVLPFYVLDSMDVREKVYDTCINVNDYSQKEERCELAVENRFGKYLKLKFTFFLFIKELFDFKKERGLIEYLNELNSTVSILTPRNYLELIFYTNHTIYSPKFSYEKLNSSEIIIMGGDYRIQDILKEYLSSRKDEFLELTLSYSSHKIENRPILSEHSFYSKEMKNYTIYIRKTTK